MRQTMLHYNINKAVLNYIPKDSKVIVDLGCMSGILAREYKVINSKSYYIGVDISSDCIEEAKKYCDKTYLLNIETDLNIIFENENNIDCWILGDILEHLVDPWSLMKTIISNSNRDTKFVICVPNFQHWTVIYKLLLGDLFYEDSGLLDRSHLRIFTRKTLIKFIKDLGLDIIKMRALMNSTPESDISFRNLVKFVEEKKYNKDLFIKESLAYQYVLIATKM